MRGRKLYTEQRRRRKATGKGEEKKSAPSNEFRRMKGRKERKRGKVGKGEMQKMARGNGFRGGESEKRNEEKGKGYKCGVSGLKKD